MIDWSKSAEQVCNQIRAMQPWPTAYTFLHSPDRKPPLRVIVCRVVAVPAHSYTPSIYKYITPITLKIEKDASPVVIEPTVPPGSLFTDPHFPGSLFVAAGVDLPGAERSVVEVMELQPAGKRRMSAAEFLRGYRLRSVGRFGPEQFAITEQR